MTATTPIAQDLMTIPRKAPQAARVNLVGLTRAQLREALIAAGTPEPQAKMRTGQVWQWIYQKGVRDFAAMTNLAKSYRAMLADNFTIEVPEIVRRAVSEDGTRKYLLRIAGGHEIEAVYIPEADRGTLCISSQVGCMLNCTFCSTATQGFMRNLTTDEIVGQVWLAARRLASPEFGDRRITNVVLMGMGEPLLNLDNVQPALNLLREDLAFGLAARRVTVSTAGVIPGIEALAEGVDVALALSLHAPDDELRNRLVPLNRKYPIAELLDASRRFLSGRKRRMVTIEYTLIDGVNDAPEHARALVRRLGRAQLPCKLNLIPFNPFPGTVFRQAPVERIEAFRDIVREAGIVTTVRRTRGDDIDAACGQLVGQVADRTRRQAGYQRQLAERALA